jgi:histidine kinase-like protein
MHLWPPSEGNLEGTARRRAAVAFAFQLIPALRLAAWAALLAIGLWVWVRRPDAAGRAFAFWALVWAGGVQMVLSLLSLATDAATQQVLNRASNYAILLSSSAFVAILLYAPRPQPRLRWLLAPLLAIPIVGMVLLATNHGAFLTETVDVAGYSASNATLYGYAFHPILWTGFLGAMLWLGWRAPRWEGAARMSAVWLMGGLALFTADRFARTAAWYVRDPTTIGPGPDGPIYGLYMLAFGAAVAFMAWRARRVPNGAKVALAALAGAAIGATSIATFSPTDLSAGVLLSALVAPAYGVLLAKGVLAAPASADAVLPQREPVLAPIET